jgi:hypothetical protein
MAPLRFGDGGTHQNRHPFLSTSGQRRRRERSMTSERFELILQKIDEVVGPPESETPEERRRRIEIAARRRELRRAG